MTQSGWDQQFECSSIYLFTYSFKFLREPTNIIPVPDQPQIGDIGRQLELSHASLHSMPPKRRKIPDLNVADTNELLLKLDQFRSGLDESDEDLPTGFIDKLEELHNKLQNTKVTITVTELFTVLIGLFLAHFLLQGGSNDPRFIEDIVWTAFSDRRKEARN